MKVLALDLSLTSTGVCHPDGTTSKVTTSADQRLEERLSIIVRAVCDAYWSGDGHCRQADLVVVEDYVTASKFAGAVGPVHGAVRQWLWDQEAEIMAVPAKSLKKYASGKGNCNKDAMGIAAMKRAGIDFSGRPDECDAWWLWAMTLDAYGDPVVKVPADQRAAIDKLVWPTVEGCLNPSALRLLDDTEVAS